MRKEKEEREKRGKGCTILHSYCSTLVSTHYRIGRMDDALVLLVVDRLAIIIKVYELLWNAMRTHMRYLHYTPSTINLHPNDTEKWFRPVADIQVLHDHAIVYSKDGDVVPPPARQPRVHHCCHPHTARRYCAKAVGDARYGVQPREAGRGPWDR